MVQKSYFVREQSELENVIAETAASPDYKNAKSILAIIYSGGITMAATDVYVRIIHEKLKRVKTAGISVIKSRKSWEDKGLTLSFCFFQKSDVEVFMFPSKEYSDDTVIDEMSEFIKRTGNVKLVFSFPAGLNNDFTRVLENLSAVDENVSYFGALAATREYYDHETYSFDNRDLEIGNKNHFIQFEEGMDTVAAYAIADDIVNSGYVFAAVSGEELSVSVRYVLGWKKLGRELNITGRVGNNEFGNACITEIDNMPAVNVYKKYLDVEADEFFMDNICEFPFLVQRRDSLIARVPSYVGNNGELFFSGDIRDDDRVTLSYAIPIELIRSTERAAEELKKMEPEAVFSTICLNRYQFLNELEDKELNAISGISENMVFSYGGSEIFKGHNYGGVLNSALATIALKEGELKEHCESVLTEVEDTKRGTIPFSERLITIIERTNDELAVAKEEAIAASKSKSAFLSNMSHEIRTPINAILGMDEMIFRETEDENILKYAENIRSAGNSLLGLVNDILDFSKIEAGKLEIIPVEYEVASVLNDLINMVRKRAEDKGLELIVTIEPQIPHLLYGDEIRLKQIVTNILTNAVKYTEKGSITLDIRCKGCSQGDNILLGFSVKDTGIGIKEEDLPKLFGAFERIEERRNRTIEGTGLGMNITRNLLEMMGSSLKVESVYGKGSTFSFELVQKVVDDTPIGDFEDALKRSIAARKKYHESFTAPNARILVVDDTVMNLTVIEGLLKQTKITIDTATSGLECIEKLRHDSYDMVFLDHRMPEMDGVETLQRIRDEGLIKAGDIPVIALTANAVSGSRKFYLNKGFDDYISKPIEPMTLEAIILGYLLPKGLAIVSEKSTTDDADSNDNESEKTLLSMLSGIEGLSVEAGVKNCGSPENYLNTLKAYIEAFADNHKMIREYFEAGDLGNYTIKVHALKSSSRIIGALELGDLSEKLEDAGNRADLGYIKEKTETLLTMYAELLGEIHLPGDDADDNAGDREEISEENLKEAYSAIYEISQMFDYDSLTAVMKSIEKYRIPKSQENRYEKLKEAVRKADWDAISNLSKEQEVT